MTLNATNKEIIPTIDISEEKQSLRSLDYFLQRVEDLTQHAKDFENFANRRHGSYQRYKKAESQRHIEPEVFDVIEQMFMRLYADPQYLSVLYNSLYQESRGLIKELEALLSRCFQTLTSWSHVTDELRYRMHLLSSVDIRLTLLEQQINQQPKTQEDRNDTIQELPAAPTNTASDSVPEIAQAGNAAPASAPLKISQLPTAELPKAPSKITTSLKEKLEGRSSGNLDTVSLGEIGTLAKGLALLSGQKKDRPDERRQHKRLQLATDIRFGEGEHCFYTGFSENLSSGGILITTYDALPQRGETFQIFFTLPSGYEVESVVEVVWLREFSERSPDISPGFGARFLDLSEEAQDKINRYIAQEGSLFMLDDLC